MHLYEVLRRPLITEKATLLKERNPELNSGYVFEVAKEATKPQIKEAVEKAFKVKVVKVNIITVSEKTKRMGRREVTSPSWKKAIVSLEPENKITFFEGV